VEHFAHFTGDTFYAHMDDEAAKAARSSKAASPTATSS
jgi:acyl dehydratase